LRGKRVDAVFAVDPFLTLVKDDPAFAFLGSPYVVVQPGLSVAHCVATEEFSGKHPETRNRFDARLRKGIEWVSRNLNTPQARELLASYTRISPALLARMAPMVEPPRSVDTDSIRKTIALMKEHGLLKTDVDVAAMLHQAAR